MTDAGRVVIGDRYELLERLGLGGMAEVWLAADLRLNGKHVAVKRLLGFRAGTDESAVDLERARREAFAASRLSHPNLVAVTDFVAENGEPFIVMEYVPGTTLAALLEPAGLDLATAARIMAQIAAALADAHEAHIVHRDIKPANILVNPRGVAKLADFGIARNREDPRFTQTGFFAGTLAYLAPELLDGQDADARSDMWSFGATLYEALEGRRAFDAPTTAALVRAIAADDPPRPTRAGPLVPLLGALLHRDPAARPTAEQAAQHLLAGLDRPAAATPSARPEPVAPPTAARAPAPTPRVAQPGPPPIPPRPPAGAAATAAAAGAARHRSRRRGWAAAGAIVAAAALVIGVLLAVHSGSTGGSGDTAAGRTSNTPATAPALGGLGGGRATYTIGFEGALSGSGDQLGQNEKNGVTLAVDQAATSGRYDFAIKLVSVDDYSAATADAATKLIQNPAVLGVVGPTLRGTVSAVGSAYGRAGLSFITPSATGDALATSHFPTFHRLTASDDAESAAAGTYLARKTRTVYVIDDATASNKSVAGTVARAATAGGATVTRASYATDVSYPAVAAKVLAARPGAVFYSGYSAGAGELAKALKKARYPGIEMSGSGAFGTDFTSVAGSAGIGFQFACGCTDPTVLPTAKAFVTAYQAKFTLPPPGYAAEAYDATTALFEAITAAARAGAVTRATVEQQLDKIDFQGATTNVQFQPDGNLVAPVVTLYRQGSDGFIDAVGDITKQ